MGEFLLYICRSSLYLAVFYAFFLLVMRRTSLFSFNRIVLLAGTAVCFVLPLVRLRTAAPETTLGQALAAGPLTAVGVAAEPLQAAGPAGPALPLLLLYVAGAAAVLAFTGLSALRLARTIRSGRTTQEDGYRLTLVDGGVHSFSWGRHIVMSRADLESSPAILTHERMHVSRRHSLDIAFFSAVTILHWFNPLVWITFSELKLLHEYEADEGVINNGIDATQYQLLLVKKAVGEHRFSLANGFRHSKLKNRITMMIKKQSPGWMRLAYLLVLPVLAGAMYACNSTREQEPEPTLEDLTVETTPAAQPQTKSAENSELDLAKQSELKEAAERGEAIPFSLLEDKPTFQGGDANKFSQWVNDNLVYPEAAKVAGKQGRVTLQFTVGPDGNVGNVKVLRGVDEVLDAEAVRIVSSSPQWDPGRVEGKPVSVTYTFPVLFRLTGGDQAEKAPDVYVDGKIYKGDLDALKGMEMASVKIDDDGTIRITLKKD